MQAQAIIYTRTSTANQTDGHQAQQHACERFALSAGLEVKASYSDTISGAADLDKRIGLMSAVGNLSKGDTLIIYRRDRLDHASTLWTWDHQTPKKVRYFVPCLTHSQLMKDL
jgi:DNA invertase Pin-like site-specific DNA recombinase